MNADFRNPAALANAIRDAAGMKLTARPFNYFEGDEGIWWLIPSTDWPAYKYGKFIFTARPNDGVGVIPSVDADTIYCGYYIEKGLNPTVSAAYPSHAQWVMGTDWLWSKFIAALASTFPPQKQIIMVSAGQVSDSHTPHDPRWTPSRLWLRTGDGITLDTIAFRPNPSQQEVADYLEHHVSAAKNVAGLASALAKLPTVFDWTWIDLLIGTPVKRTSDLTLARLWHQHLSAWKGWVR